MLLLFHCDKEEITGKITKISFTLVFPIATYALAGSLAIAGSGSYRHKVVLDKPGVKPNVQVNYSHNQFGCTVSMVPIFPLIDSIQFLL